MNTPSKVGRSRAKRAVLVYQGGIANVFAVDCLNANPFGRNARRLVQADFHTCESFARGMGVAGFTIATMACNQAGDIINAQWSEDLDAQPFSEKFNPVVSRGGSFLPRNLIMD